MPHIALLGDSVLDNAAYTGNGPCVIEQVTQQLPKGWSATLCAVDGSTTRNIAAQLARLPADTTHLLLSVGGNNALLRDDVLDAPVTTSTEAFVMLYEVMRDFEHDYRDMIRQCLQYQLPLVVCTIYHGNFPDPIFQASAVVALTAFNDVIVRVAAEHRLKVLDLRALCTNAEDYANPIEPSSIGGAKIATALIRATVEQPLPLRGAHLVLS